MIEKRAFLYVLRCTDGSLYCGITTDYKKRISEHYRKGSKCAKYMRSHDVCEVCLVASADSYSAAASCEAKFKCLKKTEKEAVLNGAFPDFMASLTPIMTSLEEILGN